MTYNEHYSEPSGQALPACVRIEEFVIERVLGSGGFGITYLARDTALGRQVVIKENLPVQFAFRDPSTLTVAPRHSHGEDVENFRWSLENFSKEAAMLASLDHPGIVRVLRSFQALGTAYFVMPFVEGIAFDTLIESYQTQNRLFDEAGLHGLLTRMLDALGYLHDRGIYHRDIKPGNILITNEGVPVLIDFGSARQRLSERSMTVVESAGYTPFEQLQSRGNVGPWSDLYALGGTLVKAITGEAPPKATDRAFDDPFEPMINRPSLSSAFSSVFLSGLDQALQMRPVDRWRDAGAWLDGLRGNLPLRNEISMPPPTPIQVIEIEAQPDQPPAQAPEGFALIPAGRFQMGDALDGMEDVLVHTNRVRAFYMAKHEVTKALWDDVKEWGANHGYTDLPTGHGKTPTHPVQSINWYALVKWCNARSERDGLQPCYTVSGVNYTTGRSDPNCNWGANGYRLPTEAEWEKAARGRLIGTRFPWGNTISATGANYKYSGNPWATGSHPQTSPVGSYPANGYGLYDITGNVWEWCWDRYGICVLESHTDPRGVVSGSCRVLRGGCWANYESSCRVAYRDYDYPDNSNYFAGFRLARSSVT